MNTGNISIVMELGVSVNYMVALNLETLKNIILKIKGFIIFDTL